MHPFPWKTVSSLAFSLLLTAGLATAQESGVAPIPGLPGTAAPIIDAHTKALPGSRPGTQRWIIQFKDRPFTLDAYRAEMWGERNPGEVDRIVAELDDAMTAHQAPFLADIALLGGRAIYQYWIINACAIEIGPQHLAAIRRHPMVSTVQPDAESHPLIKTATDANNHNSDALQAKGFTGNGVGCAIIDTGHDVNMNGSGKVHITYSRRGDLTKSRVCAQRKMGSMAFDDVHGHGTGVASIAAGWKWNTGTADQGHAYDANIAGYSIANSTNGNSSTSTMAAAYNQIAADAANCKIVATNLSYSGSSNPTSTEQRAMDSLALNADIVNCTAAGNSSTNVRSSLANINGFSVAAVNENSKTKASFSSYGMQGGRYFPNISANGVSTNMARRDNEATDYVGSGTSMSSPQVCGSVTLIRGINTKMKADETRAVMMASTLANPGSSSTIKVTGVGAGYVKNDSAAAIAQNAARHGRASVTSSWTKTIAVTANQTLQFAIAWNRTNVNSTSWANLDLRLLRGSATLVDSNTPSNTEEFVRYKATKSETLSIVVTNKSGGSVSFGWACSLNAGGGGGTPSAYTFYSVGCKGTGGSSGGGKCHSQNMACGSPRAGGNTNVFATSFKVTSATVATGARLRTNSAGKFNVEIWRTDAAGKPTSKLSGTGSITIGSSYATYTGNFPAPVSLIAGNYALVHNRVSGSSSHPICPGAPATTHYWHPPSSSTWSGPWNTQGWAFEVICGGGGGGKAVPLLTNTGTPVVGQSFKLNVSQAKKSARAFILFGATTASINLGALGAPGCVVQARPDFAAAFSIASTGSGSLSVNVPNNKSLLKKSFYNQGVVLDSGANRLGVALTSGGRGTVGDQ